MDPTTRTDIVRDFADSKPETRPTVIALSGYTYKVLATGHSHADAALNAQWGLDDDDNALTEDVSPLVAWIAKTYPHEVLYSLGNWMPADPVLAAYDTGRTMDRNEVQRILDEIGRPCGLGLHAENVGGTIMITDIDAEDEEVADARSIVTLVRQVIAWAKSVDLPSAAVAQSVKAALNMGIAVTL